MQKYQNNIKMEPLDLTNILKDYEEQWVILSKDNSKVLYFGKTLEDIYDHLKEGIVLLVGKFDAVYSPSNFA